MSALSILVEYGTWNNVLPYFIVCPLQIEQIKQEIRSFSIGFFSYQVEESGFVFRMDFKKSGFLFV